MQYLGDMNKSPNNLEWLVGKTFKRQNPDRVIFMSPLPRITNQNQEITSTQNLTLTWSILKYLPIVESLHQSIIDPDFVETFSLCTNLQSVSNIFARILVRDKLHNNPFDCCSWFAVISHKDTNKIFICWYQRLCLVQNPKIFICCNKISFFCFLNSQVQKMEARVSIRKPYEALGLVISFSTTLFK